MRIARGEKQRFVSMAEHRRHSTDSRIRILPVALSRPFTLPKIPRGRGRNFGRLESRESPLSARLRTSRHRQTIGYLSLCIWHIVKLIERGDKIAMFLTLSELRVFSRDGDGTRRRSVAICEGGTDRDRGRGKKGSEIQKRACVYKIAYW